MPFNDEGEFSNKDPEIRYEKRDPACNKEGENKLVATSECISSEDEDHLGGHEEKAYQYVEHRYQFSADGYWVVTDPRPDEHGKDEEGIIAAEKICEFD